MELVFTNCLFDNDHWFFSSDSEMNKMIGMRSKPASSKMDRRFRVGFHNFIPLLELRAGDPNFLWRASDLRYFDIAQRLLFTENLTGTWSYKTWNGERILS